MTYPHTGRKIVLQIEGRMVSISADLPLVYFAAAYTTTAAPFPSRVLVTADIDAAWDFLKETTRENGYGHLVVYDVTQAETEAPLRLKCLGRVENGTLPSDEEEER
jgi:hypothetical protein